MTGKSWIGILLGVAVGAPLSAQRPVRRPPPTTVQAVPAALAARVDATPIGPVRELLLANGAAIEINDGAPPPTGGIQQASASRSRKLTREMWGAASRLVYYSNQPGTKKEVLPEGTRILASWYWNHDNVFALIPFERGGRLARPRQRAAAEPGRPQSCIEITAAPIPAGARTADDLVCLQIHDDHGWLSIDATRRVVLNGSTLELWNGGQMERTLGEVGLVHLIRDGYGGFWLSRIL